MEALVVLSGGQDSTLSIFYAMKRGFDKIRAITFDYGQRHKIEIESARNICEYLKIPHEIIPINSFASFCTSALVSDNPVSNELGSNNLPNTFVPGRNLIFLTLACAYAYQHKILNVVTGVSQEDYSGYPDCREDTIIALEDAINLGMERTFSIHTPMMHISKAQALLDYGTDADAYECLSLSHTCYNGEKPPCGKCPACLIRIKSFEDAGMADPLMIKR